MGNHRRHFGIASAVSVAFILASVVGCNGGGGNNSATKDGGATGGSDSGNAGGQNGGSGGGGKGGAGNGGSTNTDAAGCPVTSTFNGQPGTLYVQHPADGVLTAYDTQTGALLKTLTPPGWSSGVVGGNGLLWLWNLNNDSDITPFQFSGQALSGLGIDSNFLPVFASGSVWTFAFDANIVPNVYKITSPTTAKALIAQASASVYYSANAFTASSEGFFFLGATGVGANAPPEIVHIDAADSAIAWTVSVASVPSLKSWPSTGEPSMAALPGKLFVDVSDPTADGIFSIDTATHTVGTSGTLDYNSGFNEFTGLMTDGVGLYVFDPGIETLYEIDPATYAMKRKLPLKGATDGDNTHILNPFVAAGAVWLGRICGDNTYVRRVDLATWTVADILYPSGKGVAASGYAYLAP